MKKNITLDFFYGNEAEQFNFYRIPKVLFTNKTFSSMTVEAKVLYGLLLDRMSLSIKNNWIDKENRVYIYFKLEEAMEYLNFGKDKCVKLFSELDGENGIGLIKRKKQGLGKPTIIYVMNFSSDTAEVKTSVNEQKTDGLKSISKKGEYINNADLDTSEVCTSGKQKSRGRKNRL